VHDRARFVAIGLRAADRASAVAALGDEGVAVHHEMPAGQVVLGHGLPFPVVLVDELLVGDPRR
jgi:hypothetical protein